MPSLRVVVAAALIASVALPATAHAADMAYPLPIPELRKLPAQDSGWYLRGDVAVRVMQVDHATTAAGYPVPGRNEFATGFVGGVGAGFKTGQWRVDGTIDFAAPVDYAGGATVYGDVYTRVGAYTVLLNAYYDIGTWFDWTPYVGAGIGLAHVRTSQYESQVTPPLTEVPAFGRWNTAWALMAGASYQFTPSMVLDVGYRYLGLGSAETASDNIGKFTLHGLNAHEFRVGVRWMVGSRFGLD